MQTIFDKPLEKQVADNSQAIAKLISKVPISTFSSTSGCVMGNFVNNYGCNGFVPLSGASDYTITLTSVNIYGASGDKKSEFTVGARYKTGFAINSSTDYAGKLATIAFTATIS